MTKSELKKFALPQATDGVVLADYQSGNSIVRVRETHDWRWLVFDNNPLNNSPNTDRSDINSATPLAIQSLMLKSDNSYLALPYMQAMLASLCFNRLSDSASVLQLGLGAGAINRFFGCYLPQQQLTTVELEPLVVDIYKRFFSFENNRVKTQERVIVQNALEYLRDAAKNSSEVMLCDLYTEQGLPEFLLGQEFYQLVYRVLSADGVLVINTGHRSVELLQSIFNPLRELFTYLIFSELTGYENIIIYASNAELSIDQKKCDRLQKSIDLNIYEHFSSAKTLAI